MNQNFVTVYDSDEICRLGICGLVFFVERKKADEPIFELVDVESINIIAVVFKMARVRFVGWGRIGDGVANPNLDLASRIKKCKKTDTKNDNDDKKFFHGDC